jgi:cysteinyl-tRNA synthetase
VDDATPITLPGGQPVRLFDTRTRHVLPVVPRESGSVGIYACGPTVYQPIHIGNARPFITFSWLKRFLTAIGNDVTLVINVTDVNDKIYAAALQSGVPSADLGRAMTQRYLDDTSRLGLGRPDAEPLVTDSIDEIVALIQAIVDRGHGYAVDGDVYFRVRSDERYGELSRRAVDDADQGEGHDGAGRKEDPVDFALWKATKPGEDTAWDSPWGRGRPAWHIECSAMGAKHLGAAFEIHGGGRDLVFPHHENEEAQTRCGTGHDLARIWMHSGMLQLGEEKMSKSLGNVALLSDVLDRWGADPVLYLFATAHYRQPLAFSDGSMQQAQARVARLVETGRALVEGPSPAELEPHRDAFFDALADDFNTTVALAAMAEWVREANRRPRGTVGDAALREMLWVIGLDHLLDVDAAVAGPGAQVAALVEARTQARASKDWAAADAARDELLSLGWVVRDGADGPELIPA